MNGSSLILQTRSEKTSHSVSKTLQRSAIYTAFRAMNFKYNIYYVNRMEFQLK